MSSKRERTRKRRDAEEKPGVSGTSRHRQVSGSPADSASEESRSLAEGPSISIILAAGQGTRMKSSVAKVLHELAGRPLIHYVVECAMEADLRRNVVVIGFQKQKVREALKDYPVQFVEQDQQNGTGHAVQLALGQVAEREGAVVVLSGDSPFLRPSTLRAFMLEHVSSGCDCTVLTAVVPEPDSYGRIVRDVSGRMVAIREEGDCSEDQKRIREVNSGMYCFKLPALLSCVGLLSDENVQRELYLTDVVRIMHSRGMRLGTYTAPDWREILGINTVEQLRQGEQILKELSGGR
ncbi:MAG: NTP transferase domain-containing protein [Candidatus Eiseniibacteriota bacterium]|nr:MAG: NTP transferase domain-containing protein [Candidatus Eisenbacteria bacterium]